MKELDITDPEQKKAIQNVLREGVKSQFWMIIKQRLQEHIDSVQAQLDSETTPIPAEDYKIQTEILKNKKRDRIGIIDMPEVLVHELDEPDFFAKDREEEIYPDKEDFE